MTLVLGTQMINGQNMGYNDGVVITVEATVHAYFDGMGYTNQTGGSVHGQIDNEGDISVDGDWYNNASSEYVFTNRNATGETHFTGSSAQVIGGSRATIFESLEINNSSTGVTLQRDITVNEALSLTDGILYTDATNIIKLIDNATSSSGSDISFVDGPFQKTGNDAFVFPLGDNNSVWARIGISAPSSVTSVFTAQYFDGSPPNTESVGELVNVSTTEYWTLDRNSGSSEVIPTLYWEDGQRSGIDDLNDLTVAKFYEASWLDETKDGGTTGDSHVGNMTARSQNIFGQFTFGSGDRSTNPLPVELLSFEAKVSPGMREVKLEWTTTSEINNDYFTLERSISGDHFEPLFEQNGAGNSNSTITYHGIDDSPFEGTNYYRLKQTDFDGQFSYSDVKSAFVEPSASPKMTIYPNPTDQNVIYLDIEGSNENSVMKIEIIDSKGMRVFNKYIDLHGITAEVNLDPNLPKGMYHVITRVGSKRIQQKFIRN